MECKRHALKRQLSIAIYKEGQKRMGAKPLSPPQTSLQKEA